METGHIKKDKIPIATTIPYSFMTASPGRDDQTLVDGARQMELERQVPDNENKSIIVFEAINAHAQNLEERPEENYQVLESCLNLIDKDSDSWNMYAIKVNNTLREKAKASYYYEAFAT